MQADKMKMGASVIIPAIIFTLAGVAVYAHEGEGFRTGESPELTEEQRVVLQEVKELKESGDTEGAKALAEEAGLPKFGKHGRGHGQDRQEIKDAIDNNDYLAFVEATADAPFSNEVDEAFFAKLVEAHELREAGDKVGSKAIMDELGINQPHKGRGGPGKFFHRNGENITDAQKALVEQARELHQAGEHESAKEIMEQLRNELKGS